MRKHQSLTGLNLRVKASKAMHALVNRVTHQTSHGHETLADHAQHIGTSAKQRIKLVAKGAAQEIHASITHVRITGKQMTGNAQRNIALMASRKLNEIADKFEQKANAINTNPINISGTKSASR